MTDIPPAAYTYQQMLHEEVERMWGPDKPPDVIGVSAGTIHQESAWNCLAQSPFAKGLAQFTDPTWADMIKRDPSIAELGDVWNPHAAIRAMVTYHHSLWSQFSAVRLADERWAFVLSSYNGGLGWVHRDQKLCAQYPGVDPNLWFGNVELHSERSPEAMKENRAYPRAILKRWLPLYSSF